jgi:hypothetical protein
VQRPVPSFKGDLVKVESVHWLHSSKLPSPSLSSLNVPDWHLAQEPLLPLQSSQEAILLEQGMHLTTKKITFI